MFRIVRVGLIQSHSVRPTSDPLKEQREANFDHVAKLVEAAAYCGVNIICFNELWRECVLFRVDVLTIDHFSVVHIYNCLFSHMHTYILS